MNTWALCLFTGAFTALGLIPMPRFLEKRNVVDEASQRSSHVGVVPRGAGVVLYSSFLLAVLVGLAFSLWEDSNLVISAALLVGALMFIGLADDVFGVPIAARLLLQVLIGSMVAVLASPTNVRLGFGLMLFVIVGLGVATIINTVNFMDGINGISGVTAAVVAAIYASLALEANIDDIGLLSLCVAATAIGFLPHNVPRARIFLGDSGSYYLGVSLGVLNVLLWVKGFSTIVVLAPLSLYLADVAVTLVTRMLRGERFWEPHRGHRYQRLANGGLGHTRTTVFVGVLTAVGGAASWLDRLGHRPWAIATVAALLAVYFFAPIGGAAPAKAQPAS